MRNQLTENREQKTENSVGRGRLFAVRCSLATNKGFTLIETFVAISILTVAIVAPMMLAAKSLSVSYYVRDEVTAYYLAQEAIETIRNIRDANILTNLLQGTSIDLLAGVPSTTGAPFTVDAHVSSANAMQLCSGTCPPVEYSGTFYGYNDGTGGSWVPTRFTRSVTASYVDAEHTNLHLTVTVSWTTTGLISRTVSIEEDLYQWAAGTSN